MILRIPAATLDDTPITDVMINLIDERKIRLKLTYDGKPYDIYIRNWKAELKGLTVLFSINGMEVPSKLPIAIGVRFDPIKKALTVSGNFMGRTHMINTTPGRLMETFVKMLH